MLIHATAKRSVRFSGSTYGAVAGTVSCWCELYASSSGLQLARGSLPAANGIHQNEAPVTDDSVCLSAGLVHGNPIPLPPARVLLARSSLSVIPVRSWQGRHATDISHLPAGSTSCATVRSTARKLQERVVLTPFSSESQRCRYLDLSFSLHARSYRRLTPLCTISF
jgi:hypothetical protein